ncbi:hypothetical protein [Pelobacter propionicus]|uniref:Uncharacterized protein n=1 Tax=Pelobacter propionicus (strain DSM 2379 / NBRC 103807 / OttBd1) TaxID=338966 RepID=A1ASM7_PELPD|nr:hypothetical protein [Pelobacter propionicus]ABL00348.1 conserved hypothetical protein [Pelobacter propionicus DSM 2379]
MNNDNQLKTAVGEWSRRTVPPEVCALAEAARQRHGGVGAVLFYGSCMRCGRFDEGIVDLYLLVDDYHRAFDSRLQALLNRLLPPNVFYLEVAHGGKTLRAKYAVLTLDDFARGARQWFHSYIWGRFAQPSGLVYARDGESAARVQEALADAVCSFLRRALPQAPERFTIRELWIRGLSLSYRCELRSENPAATARLFDAAPDYYEAVTHGSLQAMGLTMEALPNDGPPRYHLRISPWERKRNSLAWRLRQTQGKTLSVARLLKGLLTFENGVDYILWKIERHSGIRVESSPALSRFPLISLCVTFWRLFRKGAFR